MKPNAAKSEEVNYKKNFCEKYFDKGTWDLDVLKQVDIHLKDKKGRTLLYIESKYVIANETSHRQALAQAILTNKKQDSILSRVALVYQDKKGDDILELIDCSEDSVMYNNDFNWNAERPSSPSKDAIDRINDRIKGRITQYCGEEIKDFYTNLKKGDSTEINITEKNFVSVYNQWKENVTFAKEIQDEQDLINLFLVDILNGTSYKKKVVLDGIGIEVESPLIREGTNLSKYELTIDKGKVRIIYDEKELFSVSDKEKYDFFWKKYKRPPSYEEFLRIIEHSAMLYSEKYRKDTGGEYTPNCFVELQNKILKEHYNLNEYIVFDPCAGVGNLENQFGKDYKQYCYLSTLEKTDVDICKIKGFENSQVFDYLNNDDQPKFKYKGTLLDITEICKRENRKLMVVMNPPYQKPKGYTNNLAIEFFNKILALKPQTIVFYYTTKSFLNNECEHYIASGYKIVSHIFSDAEKTFKLSNWPISQVIFDRDQGEDIQAKCIKTNRYELEKDVFAYKGTYCYDLSKANLFRELQNSVKNHQTGMKIGVFSYLNDVIKIGNGGTERGNNVTTNNLMSCLLSKGLIFNSHHKYFELNSIVYRGQIDDISDELKTDAIMFSLFYKGLLFSNKGQKNYIMPFTAQELGCNRNDLNVLYSDDTQNDIFYQGEYFDFREFLKQFSFSKDAKDLYIAALQVFKYYHSNQEYAHDRDWNDSYYDITNAIMGKDISSYSSVDSKSDKRITKVKTTKGAKGFGRNTIKSVVATKYLPIFTNFFDVRDALAKKINKQLVEQGLLLWERENIF